MVHAVWQVNEQLTNEIHAICAAGQSQKWLCFELGWQSLHAGFTHIWRVADDAIKGLRQTLKAITFDQLNAV